ncbi:MAG TPA: DUF835 domain-containing protein [Methanomassiliicoccales archaeon]|nr:DUF835 domain-containing protein [Methanomassiliicoccales archaeon]
MTMGLTEKNVKMLVEGYPRIGFKLFSQMISDDANNVCITRLHPDYVAEKYALTKPKYYWLSGNKATNTISPKSLGPLLRTVRHECRGKKTVIFLDGLEYLLLWNDMKKVLSCLQEIGDELAMNGGSLYVCIDPLTFEQKDLDRIWAMFPKCLPYETVTGQALRSVSIGPSSSDRTISDLMAPRGLTASP